MSQKVINSPGSNSCSSSSKSSSSSKFRQQTTPDLCPTCEQGSHESKVCPWMYSRCKHIPCNGIRQLLRSSTRETDGEMFLKCSNPTCTYFEWFDSASHPLKSKNIKLPKENCCCACGEETHCYKECPLHKQECYKEQCKSIMQLRRCKNEHNRNIAYLICTDCEAFRWVSDHLFIAAKNRVIHSSFNLNAICKELQKTINM